MKRIALVGVGWHARRIYVPWLRSTAAHRWVAAVDLVSAEGAIRGQLDRDDVALVFSPTSPEQPPAPSVLRQLERMQDAGDLDTIILASDPIGRRPWIDWALDRGLDLLVDKPMTAPLVSSRSAIGEALRGDHLEVREALEATGSRLWLQAQRRYHAGYRLVARLVAEASRESCMPITHLDIAHADGMWVMPNEWDRTHHPYRHGWGKLLHSGYHLVDLAAWLLAADRAPVRGAQTLDLRALEVSAADHAQRLAEQRALPTSSGSRAGPHHGEVDVFAVGSVRERGRVRTSLSLQLMQSSLSHRVDPGPPVDPYKGVGRVRHERLTIHLGPLMTVHVHSYQGMTEGEYGVGHRDHFDVEVFRSPLLSGPAHEHIPVGRDNSTPALGHNERARLALLEAFLAEVAAGSALREHDRTIALLAGLFDAMAADGGVVEIPWDARDRVPDL